MAAKRRRNNRGQVQIGFYQMLRDVLIASINKGQFPVAIGSLIFIIMIIKMPGVDVSKLVFALADGARARSVLGWVLAVVTTACWYILRKLAEARTLVLDDCRLDEARKIRRASLEIASRALAINTGGWFVYIVPGVLVVAMYLAIYLGLSRWVAPIFRRIKDVLSIPESEIEKVVPPAEPSLGIAT